MMSATEYGIGILKNRFALNGIEEEVDPLELLKRHELERESRKKSKGLEKVSKTKEVLKSKTLKTAKESHSKPIDDIKTKQKGTEVTKKNVSIVENHYKHNSKEISDYQQFDNDREDAERTDYNKSSIFEGDSVERARSSKRGIPRGVFVRGGGRGNWRGSQRPTFDSRGKREFDRQSGSDKTGIKPIDKRDGSGSHNWGNPRDDIDNIQTAYNTEETWILEKIEEEPQPQNIESMDEKPQDISLNIIEEEENIKELTLDEWKALKLPRKTPTYNIRKAGEGEDLSQWNKMYALEKKKEMEGEEYEYEFGEFPQRVGRQKILEIEIRFKDTRSVGSGRGRGFGRGRGSYSPRQNTAANNRTMIPAPKVDDERDFPSLA